MNGQDFSKARVGQVLWDLRYGEVIVKKIRDDEYPPICCRIKNKDYVEICYSKEGKHSLDHIIPMLYWREPVIVPYDKPFSLLDELKNFNGGAKLTYNCHNNTPLITFAWDNLNNMVYYKDVDSRDIYDMIVTLGWEETTETKINDFVRMINNNKVTKEEFIEAIKEIMRGLLNE